MLTILNLFGRSPFTPLRSHMEKVSQCVSKLVDLFEAIEKQEFKNVESLAAQISELEHEADLTKNDIRNHLPKTLFLAIDRSNLLEILAIQDSIADKAEDIAVLTTLKPLILPENLKPYFNPFLNKNLECFQGARAIVEELHELLESSFGGIEATKVKSMVDDVAFKEHEADILQRKLLKSLFASDQEMSYSSFHLWQKVFESIAAISNQSEKLAYRVRMNLDLK